MEGRGRGSGRRGGGEGGGEKGYKNEKVPRPLLRVIGAERSKATILYLGEVIKVPLLETEVTVYDVESDQQAGYYVGIFRE